MEAPEDLQDQLIPDSHQYFVDEAGDGTLFNRHGKSLVGTEGCSKFFMLGAIRIPSGSNLAFELDELRAALIADPYFKGVPSFDPARGRIWKAFHAKDDLPEVRREVFQLLARHQLRFTAIIRDKERLLVRTLKRNNRQPEYRYHPNELYDSMVHRLFRNKLHRDPIYEVWFARRGKSDRTAALRQALDACRNRFIRQNHIESQTTFQVSASFSYEHAAFQATDYMLWALQRLYERGDERFYQFVSQNVSLIEDADDTRLSMAGMHYQKRKPLSLEALQGKPGI